MNLLWSQEQGCGARLSLLTELGVIDKLREMSQRDTDRDVRERAGAVLTNIGRISNTGATAAEQHENPIDIEMMMDEHEWEAEAEDNDLDDEDEDDDEFDEDDDEGMPDIS